jgi:NAD(P)-dependent dehydrogenase (short-subunit alcohol dehydrogenase family)
MDYGDLHGKTVLLTGAGGGIGRALAHRFVEAGMRVALCDIPGSGVLALAEQFGSDAAIGLEADLADLSAASSLVGATLARFGSIHCLVNNAAIGMHTISVNYFDGTVAIDDIGIDVFQRFVAVNFCAAVGLTKAAMPSFRGQNFGRIVNVTTSLETMLRPGFSPYGPSKAALEAWSASLSAELGHTGITVNVVVPGGATDTPMVPTESGLKRETLLRPEQMAEPMLYLFSQKGRSVTGQRFISAHWNAAQPAAASSPIGWPEIAAKSKPVRPLSLQSCSR